MRGPFEGFGQPISIHALRKESDVDYNPRITDDDYFNPRSP